MALPRIRRDVRDALAVYGHLLLSGRQVEKAHALFKGMRVLLPEDIHVVKSLAMTSLATGDAAAALALADEVRGKVGEQELAAVDALRGKALFALGRTDEARAALGQSLARRAGPDVNGSPSANGPSSNGKNP